jgi:hypothetical protein
MARNYFSLPLNACHLAIRIVYKLKFQKKKLTVALQRVHNTSLWRGNAAQVF